MFKKKKVKTLHLIGEDKLEAKIMAEVKEKLEQLKIEMEKEKTNKTFIQIEESTPVEKREQKN